MIKLTETRTIILSAGAKRPYNIAMPLPKGRCCGEDGRHHSSSVVAAHGARAFFPFAPVIDCELLSGLWVQPFQKLLAGMVIRGSGPNLIAGLCRPHLGPGFPDPDLFDHFAHSGRRSLTPPAPASRRWTRCAHHAAPAGAGSL